MASIPGTTYDPNAAAQEAMQGAPGQQITPNSQVPEAADVAAAGAGGARSTAQGAAGAAGLSGAAAANAGAGAGAGQYGSIYANVAPQLSEQKVQQQGIQQGAQTAQRGQTMDYGSSISGQGTGLAQTAENIDWQKQQAEQAQQGSLIQDLFQGGTALAGDAAMLFSDKRAKTNIRDGGDMLQSVADHIRGHKFFYKNKPGQEEVGVMAQDLEKTPLRTSVMDTPNGKMIDTRRLTTANTAMISDLSRKLDGALKTIGGVK